MICTPESVMPCLLPLKGDKEKKRLELLERKKENQRLLDEESARIKGKSQKELACAGKVTRAQIEEALQAEQLKQEQLEIKPKGQSVPVRLAVKHHLSLVKQRFIPTEMTHLEIPLEENVNRVVPDEGTVEARTIEDAIAALRYCVFYRFST